MKQYKLEIVFDSERAMQNFIEDLIPYKAKDYLKEFKTLPENTVVNFTCSSGICSLEKRTFKEGV